MSLDNTEHSSAIKRLIEQYFSDGDVRLAIRNFIAKHSYDKTFAHFYQEKTIADLCSVKSRDISKSRMNISKILRGRNGRWMIR